MSISPVSAQSALGNSLRKVPDLGGEPERILVERAVQCAEQALASLAEITEILAQLDVVSPRALQQRPAGRSAVRVENHKLTNQEQRVLTLVAAGFSNRRIAEQLRISDKTAKNYVHTLLVKLDVKTRTEAAAKALGGFLVDPEECRRIRVHGLPVVGRIPSQRPRPR